MIDSNQENTGTVGKGVAVVTGASSGIGKVYADRLAKRGYDLMLVARRGERLQAVADELQQTYRVHVETVIADLGDPEDLQRVAEKIGNDKTITMLVNNAGIAIAAPAVKTSAEDMDRLISINNTALARLSLAVLPGFAARDHGTLINIGSVQSFYSRSSSTAYSGTKAFVMLFTSGLQHEFTGTKVRVQLVLPAGTATEIWELAGVDLTTINPATIMNTEDCVDAALAGLDLGEAVTLPSLEDKQMWIEFDELREKMFQAMQTNVPASRYHVNR
jgi:short-subunit dehydrogenase